MSDAAWSLPGPRRFSKAIAGDLDDGRNALVFVPQRFPTGLRAAIKSSLLGQDWRFVDIAAADVRAKAKPLVEALSESLGLVFDPRVRLDAGTFVQNRDLWRRILFVDLLEAVESELREWGEFLEQHAAASRDHPLTNRCVICAVCGGTAAEALPHEDLSFGQHWWWGTVSRLDAEVHVANLLLDHEVDPVHIASIVEVASFDLYLANALAGGWHGGLDELRAILADYAGQHGLDNVPPSSAIPRSDGKPPHQLVDLWSRGGTNRWAELDPCLHSSLEVVRDGRELKTRVWRGQVRTLLPEVETERQRLADRAIRSRRVLTEYWAGQDIAGLEIGPLCKLIGETPLLRAEREQWELAKWLRDARNSLAHWDVVDAARLRKGRDLIRRAHRASGDPE